MHINTLRAIVTLISFAVFIGIVAWAWSRRNKERFADAAQLPLVEAATPLPVAEAMQPRGADTATPHAPGARKAARG